VGIVKAVMLLKLTSLGNVISNFPLFDTATEPVLLEIALDKLIPPLINISPETPRPLTFIEPEDGEVLLEPVKLISNGKVVTLLNLFVVSSHIATPEFRGLSSLVATAWVIPVSPILNVSVDS
jgi:hypothetical protein